MISQYELEKQRLHEKEMKERESKIEKGRKMWNTAYQLVFQKSKPRKELSRGEESSNLLRIEGHSNKYYPGGEGWYLAEDVEVGEVEPTTVILNGFGEKKNVEDVITIFVWAEGMSDGIVLTGGEYAVLERLRIRPGTSENPDFRPGGDAGKLLIDTYSHILDRLGAGLGIQSELQNRPI